MGSAMNTPVPAARFPSQAPTGPDHTATAPSAADLVGAQANRLLSRPYFSGRVLAVMSKATYVETTAGEVFGLCPLSQPAHTRMVLGHLDVAGLFPGGRVWTEGDRLLFENGAVLSLDVAPVWEGRGVEPGEEVPLTELGRGFERVVRESLASHSGENLGLGLPLVAAVPGRQPPLPNASSPFAAAAMGPVRRVAEACRNGRLDRALHEADGLIGLGTGLTPSGDDFAGGLLFAAWHLSRAYPEQCPWDRDQVAELVAGCAGSTSRISYAFLQDFAGGQGPRPLHNLLNAMLTGGDVSETMTHVHRVTAIGSSSGWDMLTGMMTGMLLAVGRHRLQEVEWPATSKRK